MAKHSNFHVCLWEDKLCGEKLKKASTRSMSRLSRRKLMEACSPATAKLLKLENRKSRCQPP